MAQAKNTSKTIRKPIQERAIKTVDAILQAATRVLAREGMDGASTNKIAETAGVGIASLYQYFKGKDQIIFALVEKSINRRLEIIRESINKNSAQNQTLESTVEVIIGALISAKLSNHQMEKILEEHLPRSALKLLDPFDRKLIEFLKEVLEPYREQLRTSDLEYSLFSVIQAVRGVLVAASLYRPEYLKSEEMIKTLQRMVLAELKNM